MLQFEYVFSFLFTVVSVAVALPAFYLIVICKTISIVYSGDLIEKFLELPLGDKQQVRQLSPQLLRLLNHRCLHHFLHPR